MTTVALVMLFFAGVPVGPAALVAAAGFVAARPSLRGSNIDPRFVLAVLAVFCAAGLVSSSVDTAGHLDHVSPFALATRGAALSSVGTNPAATLVLVPAATTANLRGPLLVGVNLAVGFTPVASLATLLWRDSLRARGLRTPWRAYFAVAVRLSAAFLLLSAVLK